MGTQIGANPAALLRDPSLTLAKGALLVWPDVSLAISQQMLAALSAHTGVPIDVPYNDLSPRQRRTVLFGTGEEWIEVQAEPAEGSPKAEGRTARATRPLFRFQFKGLYPALEEASKLSPRLRAMLEQFVGEIDCSECGGSRLRDDAAAVRFRERTLDQIGRTPLGELVDAGQEMAAGGERKESGRRADSRDREPAHVPGRRRARIISRSAARRRRFPAAKRSAFGWPARSAAACAACCTCSMSRRSACIRATTARLVAALQKLRDLGNTLIVVEHDREVVASADGLFDFGPGAGRLGGQIVASRHAAANRARAAAASPGRI